MLLLRADILSLLGAPAPGPTIPVVLEDLFNDFSASRSFIIAISAEEVLSPRVDCRRRDAALSDLLAASISEASLSLCCG